MSLLGASDFVKMIIRENKSMQETQPGQLASESGRLTCKGDTFVKAVGGKARSLFKSLERSFSFSTTDRAEDVSCMTIEFLHARLQAQRTVYKAEKQQVQQLVKKVMELEQKLKLEIARRKKAECDNMLGSSRYGSCYLRTKDSPYCNRRSCMMNKEGKEKGVTIGSSYVEAGSCYTSEHHKDRIDEGAMHHNDGGEVYQHCLCHQCGCHWSNCQQLPFQHWSLLDKQSNASETLMEKGARESMDSKEKKANIMLEMTKRNLNTKDDKYGAGSWNNVYKIDTEDLEESAENEYTSLNFQKMPGLVSHRFPPRKAMSFRHLASNSSIESLDCSTPGSSRNLASRGTSRELLRKCSVRAINSPRDYDERSIMSSPKKMNLGAFTDLSISSPSPQERSLYNNKQVPKLADECSMHEDILAGSESSKEIEEDGHVARQKRKQDDEGKHDMAVYPPHLLKIVCSHENCLHDTKQSNY